MGKRKKSGRAPQGPKKREPLATSFQCLFCNHENSVTVKLHKKEGLGQLDCRICGQSYSSNINYLSAAVDVYSDWIDACEAVRDRPGDGSKDRTGEAAEFDLRGTQTARHSEVRAQTGGGEENDLDGFIEDDEGDMEAGYTGE